MDFKPQKLINDNYVTVDQKPDGFETKEPFKDEVIDEKYPSKNKVTLNEVKPLEIKNNTSNEHENMSKHEKSTFFFNFNLCTKCCHKADYKAVEHFENSKMFVNYFMDVQIFLKKMLEIEVIKFCFFSKNERDAINLIVNPNDTIDSKHVFINKLKQEYNLSENKDKSESNDNISEKMKDVLEKLVDDGKDRKVSKRLIRLISDEKLKNIKWKWKWNLANIFKE